LRILHLEDDPFDGELLRRILTHEGLVRDWVRVESAKAFTTALNEGLFDLILSDYTLPSFNGIEALALARQHHADTPFIFVSGTIDEDVAVESLKNGAADYVFKNRLSRLLPAVRRALKEVEDHAESRRAEEAMRESEHKYRQVFESMSEAAFLVDLPTGRVLDANQRAESFLGRARSEIIGAKHECFHVHGKFEAYRKVLADVLAHNTRAEVESEIICKDGRTFPVQVRASTLELYGRHLVLCLCRDITKRKQAEDQFRERSQLLDLLPEAILVRDLDGRIQYWNEAATRLYGWSCEEALGRNVTELLYHDTSEFQVANQAILKNGQWQGDLHQVDRANHEILVHSRCTLLRNERDEPKSVLLVNSPIGEPAVNRLESRRKTDVLHGAN
jgi:PAS domain S-box-containing protein